MKRQGFASMSDTWRLIAQLALALIISAVPELSLSALEDIPPQTLLHSQFPAHVRPLLTKYCIDCHGERPKGSVRLDTINPDLSQVNIATWTKVQDILEVGAMPPKGEDRPTASELNQLLSWIDGSLKRFAADHRETGGDTMIRRINTRAYANIIKTLLGVPAQGLDDFPMDGQVQGFDTVGAGLYTTSGLYERYLKCAQQSLDAAIPSSDAPPAIKEVTKKLKWKDSGFEDARTYIGNAIKIFRDNPRKGPHDNRSIQRAWMNHVMAHLVLPMIPTPLRKMVVSVDPATDAIVAYYHCKSFKEVGDKGIDWSKDDKCAAAVIAALEQQSQRLSDMEQYVSDYQPICRHEVPLNRVGIASIQQPGYYEVSASLCLGNASCPLPVGFFVNDQVVRSFMLYDPQSAPKAYTATVFCGDGDSYFSVGAAFPTSIVGMGLKYGYDRYLINYMIAMFGLSPEQADHDELFTNCHGHLVIPEGMWGSSSGARDFDLPAILCREITVRGPIFPSWPPPAALRIFTRGMKAPASRDYAEEIVATFMKRACAVGICDAEATKPYVDLIMSHYARYKDFIAAVKFGLAGILTSPDFLYLDEEQRTDPARRKPLSAFALARQLAYFLWSDLPDDALMASAASGALLTDPELEAQTQRMLRDGRSRAFREGFTTQWLKIDKLDAVPFSTDIFPEFSGVFLNSAKEESVAFFSELLDKNLSVMNFIDSDFAMLNGCMARHYGIDGIAGNEFRRVQLAPGSHRGGVLAQASVLMANSNGMVSSLVRRGAFIMERLLGVSPGRPPPGVPALDKTDSMGKDGFPLSPRERLAEHRANISCARCHDRIDPLGVGLENFNALGAWHAQIKVLLPVPDKKTQSRWVDRVADVRGTMLDGTPYDGPDELKRQLLKNGDEFARCLAENMLIYALGRDLELSDKPALDRILARMATEHEGLATLVESVVQSEQFRNK